MASIGYLNSTDLINTVKREAFIPSSQSTFTNNDFLAIANQEMRIGLVPAIMQYHQEYYVRDSKDVPLVASQNNYPVPYRAIGGKVRDVYYKDTNGNLRSMTRINPDDRPYYQQTNFQNRFIYFFVQGNEVVLVPDVSTNPTGSLVFSYYLRPNDLVDISLNRTASIQTITQGVSTTVLTVDSVPSGYTTGTLLDVMQTKPGHKTLSIDVKPTAVDSVNKTITFNNSDLDLNNMVIGDYVAFAGECIIPQAPADLHDVLAQRVVLRCLQALGDQAGYQIAASKLGEMEKYTGNLIDNRTEGEPAKINNLRSTLRSAKIRKRGWI